MSIKIPNYNYWEGKKEASDLITLTTNSQRIKGNCKDHKKLVIYLDYAKGDETSVSVEVFIKPDGSSTRMYKHNTSYSISPVDGSYRFEFETIPEEYSFELSLIGVASSGAGGNITARYKLSDKFVQE